MATKDEVVAELAELRSVVAEQIAALKDALAADPEVDNTLPPAPDPCQKVRALLAKVRAAVEAVRERLEAITADDADAE